MLQMLKGTVINRIRSSLRRFLQIPPNYVGDNGCIRAAASYAAWNQIEGDYLEFGVWRGYSFVTAYEEILAQRRHHMRLGYDSQAYSQWKARSPRFFAFDGFSGLPGGTHHDRMVDYHEGAYACSEQDFRDNIERHGVDSNDVVVIPGLFGDTCTPRTAAKHSLQKAAIVMIDCDLYESTVPVLKFIAALVQQGTVLIFDDWFRFKGSPDAGEQRACREWLANNPHIELIEFWRQAPQAVSFIVNLTG